MKPSNLDDVDRGILHMLQVNARDHSASTIADEVGVAPNTVRNRIERLEDEGVIQGYYPQIDYEQAGFQLRVIFVCSTSFSQRGNLAEKALECEGVISVSEILSGAENLAIEVIGDSSDDITEIGGQLEDLGLVIHDEWFLKSNRVKPFDDFRKEVAEE